MSGQPNPYTFTAIPFATGYEWRSSRPASFNFTDGAENGTKNFVVSASTKDYSIMVNSPVASGVSSFHLAHPTPPEPQILTVNRVLVPNSNTVLKFKSLLGRATQGQTARVEVSNDDGVSWKAIFSQAGDNSSGETAFVPRFVSLASLAGIATRLRFIYDFIGVGAYHPQTSSGIGWYLDDIVISDAIELVSPIVTATAGTNFIFTPSEPDDYYLDVRPIIFGQFPLEWSPAKKVTAVQRASPLKVKVTHLMPPVLSGNQVQLDFSLVSGAPGVFRLEYADTALGPWIEDAASFLTIIMPGYSYRFTSTTKSNSTIRFYRLNTQ